jgi:hypothetical protein
MLSGRDDLLTDVWAARLFTRDRPYNLVLGIASNTRVSSALQLLSRGLTEPSRRARIDVLTPSSWCVDHPRGLSIQPRSALARLGTRGTLAFTWKRSRLSFSGSALSHSKEHR